MEGEPRVPYSSSADSLGVLNPESLTSSGITKKMGAKNSVTHKRASGAYLRKNRMLKIGREDFHKKIVLIFQHIKISPEISAYSTTSILA